MDCALVSPTVVPGPGAKLTFQNWYYTESPGDHGDVEVSTNNWATYTTLAMFKGYGASWQGQTNDLSAYAGQPVQIRFRFVSNGSGTYEGWYVDDIVLTTRGPAFLPTNCNPFVGGVWTGSVTVLEEARNIFLHADDGAGHSGLSGVFDVWTAATGERPEVLGDGSFGVISNRFGFNMNWTSGKVVIVDACTNLIHPIWLPLQTNTLTGTPAYFSDPRWSNYIGRFYRIRSP
jgi:hypothetical protein